MSTTSTDRFSEVWREVRQWPAPMRISLASRLLQSLEENQERTGPRSVADLIGAWKTENPPSDEEVARILEEEKMRKFA